MASRRWGGLPRLNWCRRGRAEPQPGPAGPAGADEPQIKPRQELEIYYEVDWSEAGLLGRGHFAEVFRGVDTRDGRQVAVKRISRQHQDVRTLRQEIAALLKVNGHSNIVRLYDVFIDQDLVVLVMELLEGGELFARIVNSGAYSEREASMHFRRITEALDFMHSHNIVHRDLKPENLVLATASPDSDIKISDFGLSKVLGEDGVMYTVCGTSAYAAPEVGMDSYSNKVDTWSLGVILFVVLSAYHPFDPFGRLDDMGLRQAVCSYQWDFNDKIWDGMSADVKDLISRLLCPAEQRLDAKGILAHPWITRNQELPRRNLAQFSMRSLRNFVSNPQHMVVAVDTAIPNPIMSPDPSAHHNEGRHGGEQDHMPSSQQQVSSQDVLLANGNNGQHFHINAPAEYSPTSYPVDPSGMNSSAAGTKDPMEQFNPLPYHPDGDDLADDDAMMMDSDLTVNPHFREAVQLQ